MKTFLGISVVVVLAIIYFFTFSPSVQPPKVSNQTKTTPKFTKFNGLRFHYTALPNLNNESSIRPSTWFDRNNSGNTSQVGARLVQNQKIIHQISINFTDSFNGNEVWSAVNTINVKGLSIGDNVIYKGNPITFNHENGNLILSHVLPKASDSL